jgi:UDP-glucose 4-epimerase
MTRRCLVTGGAGFIGSHLVDRLAADDWAVTVLDDFSTGVRANLREAQCRGEVRVVEGSILEPRAVEAAMAGSDAVFHLAVQCVRRSLGEPLQNHDVNATGTLRVLETARRQRVKRFVYCSSSEVYGNSTAGRLDEATTLCEPVTVYGAAKLAGEYYAKAYWQTYGLPTVIVRPFNAYGPREPMRGASGEVIPRFAIRVLNGLPPVIFGSGANGRDFTYVTEIAHALSLAAKCDALVGRAVNIAYGRVVEIRQLALMIARLCGRPDLDPLFIGPRPGDVRSLHADTRLAWEALGFAAETDLEEGLRRYLGWLRKSHPDTALLLEPEICNWHLPAGDGELSRTARGDG